MTQPTSPRRDRRPLAIALTIASVLAGGWLIASYDDVLDAMTSLRLRGHVAMQQRALARQTSSEVELRFQQGVVMLHARQYDNAATAFHRVLQLAPRLPEAHVNMGFAMVGLEQWASARDFFVSATELNPDQANAYYGLAVALEALGDRPGALGAMRTFVHRSPPDTPFLTKAQAAIWEWEAASSEQAGDAASPEARPAQ